jgi:hypothetical protein
MDFGEPFLMGKSIDGTAYYKIFASEQAAATFGIKPPPKL